MKYKPVMPVFLAFLALSAPFPLHAEDAPAPRYAHGLSLWGELKYKENFKHFEYVNPDAPKGGTVKLASTGSFDTLNPFIVKGNKAPGIATIFETLMTPSLDEPQSVYGLVASGVYVPEDRRYAEFLLRPEAKFQDGSPLTADDVAYTLELLKTKADPTYRILYKPVDKAEVLGPHKIRFHFADTSLRELPLTVATMPILSKKYYESHDFTQTTLEQPLASGAYRVSAIDPGRSITFELRKDYWGAALPVNVGLSNFGAIRYDLYRDEHVALEALKAGEYDMRQENIARAWAVSYDSPALREGRMKKEKFDNDVPQGMQGFVYNTRRAKFADRRVREAIGLTLDFEWMNKTLFFDAYSRNSSYFLHTEFEAKGVPEGEELALLEPYRDQLPPELFTTPFSVPVTDGSGNNRDQLKKADALLKEAGWVIKNGARVNEKTGEKLAFEFLLHSPSFERVCAPMRKHLRQLGIEASIRIVDEAQYVERLKKYDFDIVSNWINRFVFYPGNEQLTYWHSSQAEQEGGNNFSGVKRELVDTLLARITGAKTLDELRPAARALDRVLLWEHYYIPHWNLSALRIAYWDKFGRPAVTPPYALGFESWWLKGAEAEPADKSK